MSSDKHKEKPVKSRYNGFSPGQRLKKLRALNLLLASGEIRPASGACSICNDPHTAVEYHDEDYSEPYVWTTPALYAVCRYCHRHQLHTRFIRPHRWLAHIAHVRRGGYGSDLAIPEIRKELRLFTESLQGQRPMLLITLRPYAAQQPEWFSLLPFTATEKSHV